MNLWPIIQPMLNLVPEHRLNYRVVIVDGPDALSFLQAQLCNDVNGLAQPSSGEPPVGAVQAQLSGYCNAKGRLYASFWIWRDSAEQFRLLLPASLATSVVKRLSMFVLRAKVKVREADSVIFGGSLTQPIDFAAFSAQGLTLLPAERPHQTRSNNDTERFWLIGPPSHAEPSQQNSAPGRLASGLQTLSPEAWDEAEIRQGLPWFQAELSERFVPQTVNLDLLGGVSFTKGCYPGQEVVARSHYLGKLNQRMFLFEGPSGLQPGADIFLFSEEGTREDPVGEIVSVASSTDADRAHYLVSLKLEPFRDQSAVTGRMPSSGQAVMLELQALPYVVPREPQIPNRPKL